MIILNNQKAARVAHYLRAFAELVTPPDELRELIADMEHGGTIDLCGKCKHLSTPEYESPCRQCVDEWEASGNTPNFSPKEKS